MPLYEYLCEQCAHRFEVIQKYSDAPVEVCPKCGGHVNKLLSSPAIQFKGTGWYITDYARKGDPATPSSSSAASSASTETKADSKAETKTDTKSEAKTEAKKD